MSKKFSHSMKDWIIVLATNWSGLALLLFLLAFCYFVLFPSMVWCFHNFYLLIKIFLASICGVSLFSLYIWLVQKIQRVGVRALLYTFFFLSIWLITLLRYGIGWTEVKYPKIIEHEENPLVIINGLPLGISVFWYLCLKFDKREDGSGETSFLIICMFSVIALSVSFVIANNQ